MTYAMKKAEDGKNIAKCVIGDLPPQSFNEKVLMLVGATGAGKTTLLNGILQTTYLGFAWKTIFDSKLIQMTLHLAKLTAEPVQGVFGTDISSKIFLMATFCDVQNPPVISAIEEAKVPYRNIFKFNNSSLFAMSTTEGFNRLFWNLGTESFNEFERIGPTSLQLTKEVLNERLRLEALLEGLQNHIFNRLDKFNEISREKQVLKEQEREMEINENYTYKVTVVKLPKMF